MALAGDLDGYDVEGGDDGGQKVCHDRAIVGRLFEQGGRAYESSDDDDGPKSEWYVILFGGSLLNLEKKKKTKKKK